MLDKTLKLVFGVMAFIFLMPAVFAIGYFLSFATVLIFPAALFLYVYMIYDIDHAETAAIEMMDIYGFQTNLIYFEDLVVDEFLMEKEQKFQHFRELKLPLAG